MRKVRTSAGKNSYRWNWEEFKYLVAVLKQTNGFAEILNVFIDLHTQKEIAEIIRRVIIASYLAEGKTYDEISEATGCARNTIARINIKMMREKSILLSKIERVGSLEKFIKTEEKAKSRSLIDNTLRKHDIFGIFK